MRVVLEEALMLPATGAEVLGEKPDDCCNYDFKDSCMAPDLCRNGYLLLSHSGTGLYMT